ncbi:hypothetical protein Rhe02_86870 [Rhizocola hellebori]|uniref:Uncharacterized protein n=1 Tax=Rhizocola hellebori TaxID=1392758 RepID=A0A8J3QGU9_9ACTN|nr:hypothetical protein [Rhizocola hellebori]GIH10620.1 hypothetical protein Rhe02_86870 [Rhizocola hellebori]
MKQLIYPATRAVEHACTQAGVVPQRLFAVLLPLWQVEVGADVQEEQQFEVIDHFIVRAIAEGDLHDRDALVAFLGLPAGLVDRCLAYLRRIGHVTDPGPRLDLTDLGRESVSAGVRKVVKSSRQTILIERQTGWPLPRAHYDAGVAVLDSPEPVQGQLFDSTRFLRVFTAAGFDPQVLARLETHPDRDGFNLPSGLHNLRQGEVSEGFLPAYLIETTDGQLLGYSALGEHRDDFVEKVFAATPVHHLVQAESADSPAEIWREWLAQTPAYGSGELEQLPDGRWRVVLTAGDFGEAPKVPLIQLGAYRLRENHFLQVWCEDEATRQAALYRRTLGISTLPEVTTEAELLRRMRNLAGTLQVPEITMKQLREHAQHVGGGRHLDRLDALADRH